MCWECDLFPRRVSWLAMTPRTSKNDAKTMIQVRPQHALKDRDVVGPGTYIIVMGMLCYSALSRSSSLPSSIPLTLK